ncbi:fasciclin domain-containing protein [Chitinophaga niastensis]|nr:fasciclin domain-containing protein [Chitinophaga niastensis]
MKKNYLFLMTGFTVIMMLFAACKKDYYQDSGLAKGKFNGSVLDYLKSKPEYFSDVVKVIEITQMEDVFRKENITFFAPSNDCFDSTLRIVNSTLYLLGKDTISSYTQVPAQLWREMLTRYLFKGKYMLNDIPQIDPVQYKTYPGVFIRSYDGLPMNLGVVYHSDGGAQYVGYRQLQVSYTADISQPPMTWYAAPVASVNIEPDNGVVHVLVFRTHYFGFSPSEFFSRVVQYGLGK